MELFLCEISWETFLLHNFFLKTTSSHFTQESECILHFLLRFVCKASGFLSFVKINYMIQLHDIIGLDCGLGCVAIL